MKIVAAIVLGIGSVWAFLAYTTDENILIFGLGCLLALVSVYSLFSAVKGRRHGG